MKLRYVLIGLAVVGLIVGAYATADGQQEPKKNRRGVTCGRAFVEEGNFSLQRMRGVGAGVGGGRLRGYAKDNNVLGGCACVLTANESAEDGYTANCVCRTRENASINLVEGGTLNGQIVGVREKTGENGGL